MTLILYTTLVTHTSERMLQIIALTPLTVEKVALLLVPPVVLTLSLRKDLFVMRLLKYCIIHIGGLQLDLWTRVLEVEELYW